MAIDTKTMGWIQLIGALVALWAAFTGNITVGLAAIAFILLAMGYHHIEAKGHRTF